MKRFATHLLPAGLMAILCACGDATDTSADARRLAEVVEERRSNATWMQPNTERRGAPGDEDASRAHEDTAGEDTAEETALTPEDATTAGENEAAAPENQMLAADALPDEEQKMPCKNIKQTRVVTRKVNGMRVRVTVDVEPEAACDEDESDTAG